MISADAADRRCPALLSMRRRVGPSSIIEFWISLGSLAQRGFVTDGKYAWFTTFFANGRFWPPNAKSLAVIRLLD